MLVSFNANERRKNFKKDLSSGKLLRFPGAFSPLVSMLIEELGFEGVYISGAVLANDLGLPDIGLTTQTEIAQRGRAIARVTKLPSIIDIDTGFGEPMNAARTVLELEELGLTGCHLEDQTNPKRCGHLDNKSVVPERDMILKIKACVSIRKDPNFVIIARTDSRAIEGIDASIKRAQAYLDAGADMIFPEALQDEKEFELFRKSIKAPLLANMTEFGKSKLLSAKTLQNLGYNIMIFPVTTLRIAMGAVEEGLKSIASLGSQENLVPKMQTRKRLYELLKYESYNQFDQNLFNFKENK